MIVAACDSPPAIVMRLRGEYSLTVTDDVAYLEEDLGAVSLGGDVIATLVAGLGEGIRDVAPEAFLRARNFLAALPHDVREPDIYADNGEITFEWQDSADWVLSVIVDQTGVLKFAALLGDEPLYGTAPFAFALPHTLAHLLHRYTYERVHA